MYVLSKAKFYDAAVYDAVLQQFMRSPQQYSNIRKIFYGCAVMNHVNTEALQAFKSWWVSYVDKSPQSISVQDVLVSAWCFALFDVWDADLWIHIVPFLKLFEDEFDMGALGMIYQVIELHKGCDNSEIQFPQDLEQKSKQAARTIVSQTKTRISGLQWQVYETLKNTMKLKPRLERVTEDGEMQVDILVNYYGMKISVAVDGPRHFSVNQTKTRISGLQWQVYETLKNTMKLKPRLERVTEDGEMQVDILVLFINTRDMSLCLTLFSHRMKIRRLSFLCEYYLPYQFRGFSISPSQVVKQQSQEEALDPNQSQSTQQEIKVYSNPVELIQECQQILQSDRKPPLIIQAVERSALIQLESNSFVKEQLCEFLWQYAQLQGKRPVHKQLWLKFGDYCLNQVNYMDIWQINQLLEAYVVVGEFHKELFKAAANKIQLICESKVEVQALCF
eukprot:TRINITY_DN5146_c0_g1_i6.p1 TRINITY_DN5146_c0_g1~~TRINITY_DN5146_c0_g1_i6.p1  ORF type:complete len:463 (-),score=36.66 TRINITY_DN5146_c0_g1_i6:134-1477(-)